MTFDNLENLFKELIQYNESNIEYLGQYQIPMTNIYYIVMLDPLNIKVNKYIDYLYNYDYPNPFTDENGQENFTIKINIEREQMISINLLNPLKSIDYQIDDIINTAKESGGKLCLVIDIDFIFKLMKNFLNKEIHLYDYILHKNEKSIIYNEINMYMNKNFSKPTNFEDFPVNIYKIGNNLYWKILRDTQQIQYIKNNNLTNQNDFISINKFMDPTIKIKLDQMIESNNNNLEKSNDLDNSIDNVDDLEDLEEIKPI